MGMKQLYMLESPDSTYDISQSVYISMLSESALIPSIFNRFQGHYFLSNNLSVIIILT